MKDVIITGVATGIGGAGTVSLNHVDITASSTAVSSGNLTVSNHSTLNGASYAVYVDSGTVNIADSTLISSSTAYYQYDATSSTVDRSNLAGAYTNRSGTATLSNSDIAKSGDYLSNFISNSGTMNIDTVNATMTTNSSQNNSPIAINNSGEMHINNLDSQQILTGYIMISTYNIYNSGNILSVRDSNLETKAQNAAYSVYFIYTGHGIYNASGTVTIDDTDISIKRNGLALPSEGIANDTGSVTINGGTIDVDGSNAYGIYNGSGTITLGTPESPSSSHYGQADADVDINYPTIRAIGSSNGIGVHNNDGSVYFYDGRIIASTTVFQPPEDIPTAAEYQYEACLYTDTSTTPTTYYSYLTWMRGGQHACSNN